MKVPRAAVRRTDRVDQIVAGPAQDGQIVACNCCISFIRVCSSNETPTPSIDFYSDIFDVLLLFSKVHLMMKNQKV